MVIEYETSKYVKEKQQLEIDDINNVFLQGTNPYDGLPTYFGIWKNNNRLVIITIISWRNISYKCYLNINLSTNLDIRDYLEHNKNVKVITRNEFKEQIQHITMLLEI